MDGWLDRTPRRGGREGWREGGKEVRCVRARAHAPNTASSSVIFMASAPGTTPTHAQIAAQQVRDKQKASGGERYNVYVAIRTWHDDRFRWGGERFLQ